jgi:hypothetical protein
VSRAHDESATLFRTDGHAGTWPDRFGHAFSVAGTERFALAFAYAHAHSDRVTHARTAAAAIRPSPDRGVITGGIRMPLYASATSKPVMLRSPRLKAIPTSVTVHRERSKTRP